MLVGPRRVGKSHLARGIAALLNTSLTVVETTGGELIAELNRAIENDDAGPLRARYHSAELLIVDDLDRLAGKRGAQSFMLHAFDEIVGAGGRIVATARQFPLSSGSFSPALASRLASGLVVPLAMPGPEVRTILLKEIARQRGVDIADRAASLLAQRLPADARMLSASILELQKMSTEHRSDGRQARPVIDLPQVRKFLLASNSGPKRPTIGTIVRAVSKHYALTPSNIVGPSRNKTVVAARGMSIYLARKLTEAAPAKIGQALGGRDRTTVMHAFQKIERLIQNDAVTHDAALTLLRQLECSLAENLLAES